VRTRTAVASILVEDGCATGVELRDGTRLTARAVISNLDKPATLFGLVGRRHLDQETAARIETIEQRGAYVHLLFKLRRLPTYGPPFEHLNADPRTRFNTTLVPDPELQQASYEACRRGEVPEHPPVGMQIPTVMDPSLAPEGFHIATTYGFFFPARRPARCGAASATRWPSASSIACRSSSPTCETASSSVRSSRPTTSPPCRARRTATSRTA
jgi:phytoene dehydrogenase-like protein